MESNQPPVTNNQQPSKNKIGAKEIIGIILVSTVLVLFRFGLKAIFNGGSSSSSSSYQVDVDLDLPEREPIDFKALVDEAFEESASTNVETNQ